MVTRRHLAATAVVAAGSLLLAAPANAGSTADSTAGHDQRTVATGLNSPRGIAVGPHGEIYVAEAGRGGAGPCHVGGEGDTVCFGRSGSIVRISHGQTTRLVRGLPSLANTDGTNGIGPSDVAIDAAGHLYYTVGLGGSPDLRTGPLSGMAKLYKAGQGPAVADIGGFEKSRNPDGVQPPDTNPNSVVAVRGGLLVADAGGNSLVKVGTRGRVSTVAVFGPRTVPAPAVPGGPPAGTPIPMQAVPTSVVQGPDGAFYVGELTGFPFPKGMARVWRIVPGHAPQVYARGFTNIIDLAWGPDHKLYVLEIARNGLLSGDQSGALLRVERHGAPAVVVAGGLTAPGGLAITGRTAYISNCSVCAGNGSILKVGLGR